MTDSDHAGRVHAVWPVRRSDPRAAALAALAGQGDLVVADGNHRSLAAQIGGLPRFLAVVTTPASVDIQPYHRLVVASPLTLGELLERLSAAGATVAEAEPSIPFTGTVVLYGQGRGYAVTLPHAETVPGVSGQGTIVDTMDHALVERVVAR